MASRTVAGSKNGGRSECSPRGWEMSWSDLGRSRIETRSSTRRSASLTAKAWHPFLGMATLGATHETGSQTCSAPITETWRLQRSCLSFPAGDDDDDEPWDA